MRILFKSGLVCFLSIFLFHSGIEAQVFEKLNGPSGGGGKVYEGRNGVLFQIINDSLLYRSVNGGSYWTKMPATPDGIWYLSLRVGLDGNLFCSNFRTLYKSVDDGQSWDSINVPSPYYIVTATSLPDGTILVASDNQVLKSTDNGQNWIISNLSQINQFFYNSYKDETYAITDEILYSSKDKGISWQFFYADSFGGVTNGKDLLVATNGTMFVTGYEFIWKFDASGHFVKKIDLDFKNYQILSPVEMAISSTGRLFAFQGYISYYSDDLGETWVDMINSSTVHYPFRAFTSTKSGVLFGVVVESGSLCRSIDDGATWNFSAQGLLHSAIVELDFISESKLLALTFDGLFYSEDGGNSWTLIFETQENPNFYSERSQVVNYGKEFYYAGYSAIYYFKDWKTPPVIVKTIIDSNFFGFKIFINPYSGSLFYANGADFSKSTDKGINWSPLQVNDARAFYTFPDGSIIVVSEHAIYKSIDDGIHWELVVNSAAINFDPNTKIMSNTFSGAYIICSEDNHRKIVITDDYGTTWSSEDVDPSNPFDPRPDLGQAVNNVDYLYTSSDSNNILISVDRGRTFNIFSKMANLGLSISPDQKLYALTFGDGLYRTTTATSSAKILRGNVFGDLNLNCDKNASESVSANRLVIANNSTDIKYGYSRKNGSFSIPIENGNYQVNVVTDNTNWNSCDKTIRAASYNFNDTMLLGLQVKSLCPYMKVDIQSSVMRRCFGTNLYVKYSNTGTVKADQAFVEVTLDPFFEFVGSSIPINSQNGNVYRFLLGDVDENASGSFIINVKISCNAKLGQIHCAEAHIYPDSSCVQTSQAIIRTNAICVGDSIDLIIRNDGNKTMTSAKKWLVIDLSNSTTNYQAFDGGSFYLSAGQVFTKRIASRDKVLFMAEQDDSYPYNKSSRTEINSCTSNPLPGSPALSIINEDEEEPYISKFCDPNRGSFDPNEITGFPEGISDKRYIDKDQQLEYIIRFQNTGTDTAFNVRIENKIPTKELDVSTLSFGASSHPYEFVMNPDGKLIFTFKNILLPDSSINEKTSHGFIQYTIKPVDKLSNGTKILNDALIYFDFNEAVNTNIDLHTIGIPIPVKVNEVKRGNETDFQIKPNPMLDFSTILINSNIKNERYKLTCLDVYSKQMWEKDVIGNRMTIAKGELKPGIYFLVLKSANGLPIKSRKFIVQ